MSIPEPTSIIDLLAPPKGYDFYAGIWLTHDLDWSTLCDLVADNVSLLIDGKDSSFQNKIHLAMAAKGFGDDKEKPDA